MYSVRLVVVLTLLFVLTPAGVAQPASLLIGNFSFELPSLADAAFNSGASYPQQGGYGWSFSFTGTTSGMYNPPANTYATAGGNGQPTGAHGSQAGWSTSGSIFQTLAGPDQLLGNADDPVLTSSTTYTLIVAIGARLPGNQYGIDAFGGYDIGLLAGSTYIVRESNAFTPAVGTFAERSLTINSATLNPSLYGQPLSIHLFSTQGGVTDFDNVRLVSLSSVPEPAMVLWLGSALVISGGAFYCHRRSSRRRRKLALAHLGLPTAQDVLVRRSG